MITKEELGSKWNLMADAIKEKFHQVTDEELREVNGSVQRLIALLQQKTGQNRQQVEAFMSDVCAQNGSTLANFYETMSGYAESASASIQKGYKQLSQHAQEGFSQSSDAIASRPVLSVGAALGIGLIAGIAIGMSLAESRRPEPSWRDRWSR
jgi:uncharacterized protein YjbJ (UPF0337 family)